MLIFNKSVSFGGGGQLSTGLFFSAEFLGQLSTSGKFRPGLLYTGPILTTKVLYLLSERAQVLFKVATCFVATSKSSLYQRRLTHFGWFVNTILTV